MPAGIATTWEVLATTANEAAVEVLLPALDSPWSAIRDHSLKLLLARRHRAGQLAILRRLHEMNEPWRAMVHEHRGEMTPAIRDAVLDADPQTCANGCEAVVWFREYDLLPALLNALESANNPHVDLHAATIVRLAEQLFEELSLPRDQRQRRDPQRARGDALQRFEASLLKFPQHNRKEVVEGFLLLATRENPTLKTILADPLHRCYLPVMELLLHSDQPGILRLVLSALDDPHPAPVALTVLGRRQSPKFISQLLKKIGLELSAVMAANLKKIKNIGWTRPELGVISKLGDAEQLSVVKLVTASGIKRPEALETVEFVLRNGLPAGRKAATEMLDQFSGERVTRLGLAALNDEDPHVQAAAIKQVRSRGAPGVLGRLIEMSDSPHTVVRSAVRETLTEFRFARYLAAFDMLDDDVRRSTGAIVRKIDTQTIPLLSAELHSPVRTRRLRALAVTMAIGAGQAVECHLREALAGDEDHMVRRAAAQALAACVSPAAIAVLQEALLDSSVSAREAAQLSLDEIEARSHTISDPLAAEEGSDA